MRRKTSRAIGDERDWYRDAIIYEARVRSFYDKNGDGIGDFQGLAGKLDYLQDLGVTAIWLLPFYPSPLRDDGYDISDYTDVHPDVGTLADFKVFLDEAHRRGLRVITELVLNHTSDQHAWFQRARLSAPGTPERDFYVWSDTPERYADARIIFKDFEPSNWSWDPKAKAYFWHRFYAHQPDLNFENPAVHEALLAVVDQWFELGVDGLRLDAVPYLYEEEGSNCENLPRTHDFLRTLRAHVDKRFGNRMLLAEANQWPEDAVAYFGAGDECHMCFHFPIMPRLFMSIHMEDRFPIIDILAQTPPIPEGCQWAIFLRNHDELTLEMVTDEERDYMYTAYAHEPTMRINLGIRRRLSPLVGSDRRKLELMNGLLFSLPGTPVLYYGDEIGMGDNHYLGDRNGVRTPMQWSADRNAGFSLANPQRLILPIIIDPDYHYESINVEAQQNNPSSLLWWTKRLIALRKRYKAFGRGSFEVLSPQNSSVLAFVRGHGEEAILVVANLSRHVQYVQLDLSRWKGQTPVELSGRTRFPPIEDAPYLLTLGGHAFYWMSIEPPKHAVSVETWQPPTIEVAAWEPALGEDGRGLLEEILPNWLPTRPWFKAAGRIIAKVTVVETAPIALETRAAGNAVAVELVVVEASFANGEAARYLVPVGLAPGERAGEILLRSPQAVMAMVRVAPEGPETLGESGARRSVPDSGALLYDALLDAPSAAPLLHAFAERMHWRGRAVEITATLTSSLPPLQGADTPPPRVERSESGRPAVVFSDTMVLKVQRQLDEGTSQDLEIKRFFSEHVPHAQPAALLGALEQRPLAARGPAVTLATLERFVANEGDAWGHARAEVSRYFERVLASGEPAPPLPPGAGPADLVGSTPPPRFLLHVGAWLDSARLLGKRVAETHRHLATGTGPAFAPEPYSALDQRSLYQSMRNLTGKVLGNLQKALPSLPPEVAAEAAVVLEAREKVYDRFELQLERRLAAVRTRCHGSLSLEGVLFTGKDFVIIDFEGDRDKPLSERRRKRSPLSDVASLLRSYHYAAMTTVLGGTVVRDADRATALPWAEAWHLWTGAAVVAGWLEGAEGAPFVPADTQELVILLDGFLLERALAELGGELATRPERAIIPLLRLTRLLREHQPA